MGIVYTPEELVWLATCLKVDCDRLCSMFDAATASEQRMLRVATGEAVMRSVPGNKVYELFMDEVSEEADLPARLADITLIAAQYWVSCNTQAFAVRLAQRTSNMTDVSLLSASQLKVFFASYQVNLANVRHAAEVELLRLFATSWKHNAAVANTKLLRSLILRRAMVTTVSSSLADKTLRDAIGLRLQLGPNASHERIVKTFLAHALVYLNSLASMLP